MRNSIPFSSLLIDCCFPSKTHLPQLVVHQVEVADRPVEYQAVAGGRHRCCQHFRRHIRRKSQVAAGAPEVLWRVLRT